MDLVINNLPDDVGRKIKALSILTGNSIEAFRTLFADAIVEKLNVALHNAIGYASPEPVPSYETTLVGGTLPPVDYSARHSQLVNNSIPKAPVALDFVDGLGEEDDTPNPGPEPEDDEENNYSPSSGQDDDDDLVEKEFGVVPDDMEDDDALYADAHASYGGTQQARPAPQYLPPAPALTTSEDQMNFFAANTGGGFAATSNRRIAAPMDGVRRPASLASDEPMVDVRSKKRGPKVSMAR